jgi:hypothetical protein
VRYGNVDTMRNRYSAPVKTSSKPPGILKWFAGKAGAQTKPKAAKAQPPQIKPKPTVKAAPTKKPAKPSDPRVDTVPRTVADLKARGFVLRGCVSKSNSAGKIAGRKWNASDTYYTIRDKVISGDKINPSRIENGMGVWTKR